ncbi:MAG: hypothetical protein R2795_05535 [Saprospiraceae bacterium]
MVQNGCSNQYQVLLNGVLVYTGTYGDNGGTVVVDADGTSDILTFRESCGVVTGCAQ